MIRCRCGFIVFDGLILKMRVGQFSKGFFNIKCPRCKRFLEGLNIKLLTGEIETDIDFRNNGRKAVIEEESFIKS